MPLPVRDAQPHRTHRRATLITLTQQGQAVASAWSAEHRQGAGQLFGDISAADLTAFVATLDKGARTAPPPDHRNPQINEHN